MTDRPTAGSGVGDALRRPGRGQRRRERAGLRELAERSTPLNESPPAVYRIDLAAEKAAQIAALPPHRQSRAAAVLVRCPAGRELLARVFHIEAGLLVVPLGRVLLFGTWRPPTPWLLDEADEGQADEVIRTRGRCCAREHVVSATTIRAAVVRRVEDRPLTITVR